MKVKRYITVIFLSIFIYYPVMVFSQSAAIETVLGGSIVCQPNVGNCTPIPIKFTSICTASCVRWTRPSFTSSTRFWGSSGAQCFTSNDGGLTWAGCATQPFNSGGKENYAEASDGSVIGTARVGADCKIAKSINNGTSWTVVSTLAGELCGGAVQGATQLTCFSDASCVFIYRNFSGRPVVVRSTDNGSTWGIVFTGATTFTSIQSLTYDLSNNIAIAPNGSGVSGLQGSNTAWVGGSVWASGSSCWGTFMLAANGRGVCFNGTNYEIRDLSTGLVLSTPTLAGALTLVNSGGVSFGYNASTVYTLATFKPLSGSAPIGIYVSTDGGTTYSLLTTTPSSANAMREGDFWMSPRDGCLYFSAGSAPMFGKIC